MKEIRTASNFLLHIFTAQAFTLTVGPETPIYNGTLSQCNPIDFPDNGLTGICTSDGLYLIAANSKKNLPVS